jgi:hypothetical protein
MAKSPIAQSGLENILRSLDSGGTNVFRNSNTNTIVIKSPTCTEWFTSSAPTGTTVEEIGTHLNGNRYVPCAAPAIHEDKTVLGGFNLTADVVDEGEFENGVHCRFTDVAHPSLTIDIYRVQSGFSISLADVNIHCESLLPVAINLLLPQAIAVPMVSTSSKPVPPASGTSASTGVVPAAPVRAATSARVTPQTSITVLNKKWIVAQTSNVNPDAHCKDVFGEFDPASIPASHLDKVVTGAGYRRCRAPPSDWRLPSILGKYRWLKSDGLVEIDSSRKTITLDCQFKEENPRRFHRSFKIRLTREAPRVETPDELFEASVVHFNRRMDRGKHSQEKECIFMLHTFIEMQNEFLAKSGKDTSHALLQPLDTDTHIRKEWSVEETSELSLTSILLIVFGVIAALVGFYYLYKLLTNKKSRKPSHRPQRG